MATAGDVNGDGFSDVIVGAPWYDNGQTTRGEPSSTTARRRGPRRPRLDRGGEPGERRLRLVRGDGGRRERRRLLRRHRRRKLYDNGQNDEGRAFVYHGSAAGLSTTAAWTAESNQAVADFGFSVATAGDVNGDGFSDVIVGAIEYDNGQERQRGAGLRLPRLGSGARNERQLDRGGDQVFAAFGFSVATAGDVNGDGFSDVIVGAVLYDNGRERRGASFRLLRQRWARPRHPPAPATHRWHDPHRAPGTVRQR